jgi:hypothetical protein
LLFAFLKMGDAVLRIGRGAIIGIVVVEGANAVLALKYPFDESPGIIGVVMIFADVESATGICKRVPAYWTPCWTRCRGL